MRVFNIFIIVLSVLLLAGLGLGLLAAATPQGAQRLAAAFQGFQSALEAGGSARAAALLAGLAALALAFSAVLGNLRQRRYERSVVFHNPLGEVMITLGALEDMGKAVKAEIGGLKDIRLRVKAARRGIQVTARVVLWSDANLPKATELIQESVRRYLQEVVGAEQEIRPRVIVSKVAFRDPESYEAEEGELRPRRIRRPMV